MWPHRRRPAASPNRWTVSTGAVLALAALIATWPFLAGSELAYSPSEVSADTTGTGGTGGTPGSDRLIGFDNGHGGFHESISLDDSGSGVLLDLFATGMEAGIHDTVQLQIEFDPSLLAIASATCSGLFQDAFNPGDLLAISDGVVGYMCASATGVEAADGAVAQVQLVRIADGESVLELTTNGDFGTRLYAAGEPDDLTPAPALLVTDPPPDATATPTASPTPTPTATPTPSPTATETPSPTPSPTPTATPSPTATSTAPGGGGGGGAPAPAPTSTPAANLPGPPLNVTAVAGDGQATVSWREPEDDGGSPIAQYVVRSADGSVNKRFSGAAKVGVVSGLQNGREYSFRVAAITAIGAGPFSSLSAAVLPAGLPGAPVGVAAYVTDLTYDLGLSWLAPLDDGGVDIEAYIVGDLDGRLEQQRLDPDVRRFIWPAPGDGEYRLFVSAVNLAGTGVAAEVSAVIETASPDNSTSDADEPTPSVTPMPIATGTQSSVPQSSESERQIGLAIGALVELTGDSPVIEPQGSTLSVLIPARITDGEPADPDSGLFSGFSVEGFSVTADNSAPALAVIVISEELELAGEASISTVEGGISVELRSPVLRLSPTTLSEASTSPASSLMFESTLASIEELPGLRPTLLTDLRPPHFPAASDLLEALAGSGWTAAEDSIAASLVSGTAVQVEHTPGGFAALETVYSFDLDLNVWNGGSLLAVKADDAGEVHLRRVTCARAAESTAQCAAVFDGDSAGFSSFAVLSVEPLEPSINATPGEPSATSTSAATPESTPVPLLAETPMLAPGEVAEVPPAIQEPGESTSVVVIVALAAVGTVIAVSVAGYAVRLRRSGAALVIAGLTTGSLVALFASADLPVALRAEGSITSEGDSAQRSHTARIDHGIDGTGITVAIISDSIGCDSDGLAADKASGDLPADIDTSGDMAPGLCDLVPGTDRGRLLAQVVHDVAPGASIVFRSVTTVGTGLVAVIEQLIDAEVDVIVDDLLFGDELFFQDGATADAVDRAEAAGIVYVASAGDVGMASYEAPWVNGGVVTFRCLDGVCTDDVPWHDFDPNDPGLDQELSVTLSGDPTLIMLQWDQPSVSTGGAGALSNLDLYVLNDDGNPIELKQLMNVGGDALEAVVIRGETSVQLAIAHLSGPEPDTVKLLIGRGATINEFDTGSSTIVGHRNAAGALTVGPVDHSDTPVFGGTPVVEEDSPVGGLEILFDDADDPISPLVSRQKPDVVGPSGVATTEGTFRGSSAAAAHMAGAVALLLELGSDLRADGVLDPAAMRRLFTQTAIDVGDPGHDHTSGHGLIDVVAAANMLASGVPVAEDDQFSTGVDEALNVLASGVLANDSGGGSLTVELVDGPANGVLDLQPDGSLSYDPELGFAGVVTFTYAVSNGIFTSDAATVTVQVNGLHTISAEVGLQGVGETANFGSDLVNVELSGGISDTDLQIVPGSSGQVEFTGIVQGIYRVAASTPGFLSVESADLALPAGAGTSVSLLKTELRAGDADSDGDVDSDDAVTVAGAFGTVHAVGNRTTGGKITDLNGDGATNGADASLTVSNIGLEQPLGW